MIYPDYIVSLENQHIKLIKRILISPRNFPGCLVVEGIKHAQEFQRSSYFKLIRWFVVEGKQHDFSWINPCDMTIISEKILFYLTDLDSSQGVIGFFQCGYSLSNQNSIGSEETFILDEISDPGNMGALIRTAVALGRKQFIVVGGVFPFSAKVIRASAGMIAHIKILRFSLKQMIDLLFQSEIKVLKMGLGGEIVSLQKIKSYNGYCVLLGNEGNGIRKEFDLFVKKNISLPMSEKVESLNVGVAGGVIGYLMWGNL